MVSLVISFLLALLIPFLILLKKDNILFFLCIFSATSEVLLIPVAGFRFSILSFTSIFFFILGRSRLRSSFKSLKLFWIEYIIMTLVGLYILLFQPWSDPYFYERLWTQTLSGRTLTGIIRVTELFLIMHLIYVFFKNNIISFDIFLKYLSISLFVQIIIGLIDIPLNGKIKTFFSPIDLRIISDRFTGLNVEPRTFGRLIAIWIITLFIYPSEGRLVKWKKIILIIVGILSLLLTMSASAITTTIICLIFLTIYYYKLKLKFLLPLIFIIYSGYFIINYFTIFKKHIEDRIGQTMVENALNVIPHVPLWISGLEVFDASATAFLYSNPKYIVSGVGPNTISIPASYYMSDYSKSIYGNKIDSVPHMGIIQIISRSGLIGFSIILYGIISIFIRLDKLSKRYSSLFVCYMIFNAFVITSFYYIFIGMFLGIIKNNKHVKYCNSCAKWCKLY